MDATPPKVNPPLSFPPTNPAGFRFWRGDPWLEPFEVVDPDWAAVHSGFFGSGSWLAANNSSTVIRPW